MYITALKSDIFIFRLNKGKMIKKVVMHLQYFI